MEMINRMRKDKKGFTLVEIIVVLVILAILAAFTIPTMLGFVNDAKGKAYIAQAREVYVAAQATATEMNATQGLTDADLSTALSSQSVYAATSADPTTGNPNATTIAKNKASYQMKKYVDVSLQGDLTVLNSGVPSNGKVASGISAWTVTIGTGTGTASTGKVTTVVYYSNGYKVTISGGNASVVKL